MNMKPKKCTRKERALLYRRYNHIVKVYTVNTLYKTVDDNRYWVFNSNEKKFVEVLKQPQSSSNIFPVESGTTALVYSSYTYYYLNGEWHLNETQIDLDESYLKMQSSKVSEIQQNHYYYAGSFSFNKKGTVEKSETQFIKGNIMDLTSFRIEYFNDDINLDHDDLVVVDRKLYSVESPSVTIKQQPKEYKIYNATLNSII